MDEKLTEAELMARDEAEDAELLAARTPEEYREILTRQLRESDEDEDQFVTAEQSNREIREMLDELDEQHARGAQRSSAP